MPAILVQVRGNAVGASRNGKMRGLDRVRMDTTPCVAQGCDVIDVHPEPKVRNCRQANGPSVEKREARIANGE